LQPQVEALLASGQYIGGAAVQRFEEQFAQFLGGGPLEAVGCNSGTDALVLALQALGIQAGDEVLTSAFSFFAIGCRHQPGGGASGVCGCGSVHL
jgi:dTDP-4-amino-4,6-dideoxygalactose transaminase